MPRVHNSYQVIFRLFPTAQGTRRAAAGLEGCAHILHSVPRSFHPQRTHTFLLWLQRTALSRPGAQKLTQSHTAPTDLPAPCFSGTGWAQVGSKGQFITTFQSLLCPPLNCKVSPSPHKESCSHPSDLSAYSSGSPRQSSLSARLAESVQMIEPKASPS